MRLSTMIPGFLIVFQLASLSPVEAAVREYFGSDEFAANEDGQVIVNVWDVNVLVRSSDASVIRCTTDLRIAGTPAAKADRWIAARIPAFTERESALHLDLEQSDEGFLGIGTFTRKRRIGLVIPNQTTPDLSTSSGSIELDGDFFNADPLRLRTGSGAITVDGAAESLKIRTTSGQSSIRVVRPLKRFWARTASGGIAMTGGARSVEIETGSGDVTLTALSGSASVTTVSGTLIIDWDSLGPDAVVVLRSLKGDITVTLPDETRPQGVLTTSSGHIKSEFPGEVNDAADTVTLAGDGPRLEVETASGNILLRADRGWFAPSE